MAKKASPTIRQIASACGFSPATVSLALRGDRQISGRTRECVQKKAREMGYQINPLVSAFMAYQRSTRTNRMITSTLGFLTDVPRVAFAQNSCWARFLNGARARALQLGYSLDPFFLADEPLPAKRINQILQSRGIRGILLCGFASKDLRSVLDLSAYATTIIGCNPNQTVVPGAENDHVMMMQRVFDELSARNYNRIAMALHMADNKHADYHYKLAFSHLQFNSAGSHNVPLFNLSTATREDFARWLRDHRPDVVISKYNIVQRWLQECGWNIPEDIGYVGVDLEPPLGRTSGIYFNDEKVAEAAIDQITAFIHRNEIGMKEFPCLVFIQGAWIDGCTLKPPSPLTKDNEGVLTSMI